MVKVSARSEKNREKVELRSYKAKEALQLLKETATAKFNESAEAHISLKLDTKYADQQLRTTIILPQGTGKKVRIAVIAEGDKIKEALDAGADIAGGQDLVQVRGIHSNEKVQLSCFELSLIGLRIRTTQRICAHECA